MGPTKEVLTMWTTLSALALGFATHPTTDSASPQPRVQTLAVHPDATAVARSTKWSKTLDSPELLMSMPFESTAIKARGTAVSGSSEGRTSSEEKQSHVGGYMIGSAVMLVMVLAAAAARRRERAAVMRFDLPLARPLRASEAPTAEVPIAPILLCKEEAPGVIREDTTGSHAA